MKQQEETTLIQRSLKWIVLSQFCVNMFLFCNNVTGMMLVPIWSALPYYYQIEEYKNSFLTGWLFICPLLFSSCFNIIIQKYYGVSQLLSALLTSCGIWIAWYGETNFSMAVFGYSLIGLGYAFICQVPLYISEQWFEPEQRIISTLVAQYSNNFGNLFGYIFASLYFMDLSDFEEISYRINKQYFYCGIFSIISFLLSIIGFIKPNKLNKQLSIRDNNWISMKKILIKHDSIFDLINSSAFIAFCWLYPSLLAIQQQFIGQNDIDIFICSLSFQISGIIVAIYFAICLDRQSKNGIQQKYDHYLKIAIILGYSSLIFQQIFFENLPISLIFILNIFIGGGINSIYSLLLESLMEKHYPTTELAIGTIITDSACILYLIALMILNIEQVYQYCLHFAEILMIIPFCYLVIFYQTTYNRFEQEI